MANLATYGYGMIAPRMQCFVILFQCNDVINHIPPSRNSPIASIYLDLVHQTVFSLSCVHTMGWGQG